MTNVTRILHAIEQGDARAADELLPLVYEELCLQPTLVQLLKGNSM
ncbi:MAG TPA: hypothetical protein DIU00_14355 [Phycisphaerales bacterium]|nr:hypothetical protein [Phycisphaerales bacterium]